MPDFLGLPCREMRFGAVSLLIAETVGPRILSLRIGEGENVFAEVPDYTLDCPGGGKLRLLGGHRFWVAPEEPARTWRPDDRAVTIGPIEDGLEVVAPPCEVTWLQKSLRIQMSRPGPAAGVNIIVRHSLKNVGFEPVSCAPWGVTMLKPGGTAFIRHRRCPQDTLGLQPDRHLVIWPYTDVCSEHIEFGNELTKVHARLSSGALKLGFVDGLSAYWRNRTLFTKFPIVRANPPETHVECYCNPRFIELETLGQVAPLAPGRTTVLHEVWTISDGVEFEGLEASFLAPLPGATPEPE
ncbi:MAG: hypothetical protein FD180_4881 [Planctomycetota bacterium]|nr:MAG: hypothetical protein FD180_4881 [Planctomycetota bacterium]